MNDVVTAARLVSAIVDFLGDDDLLPTEDVRAELLREVDAAGPAALLELRSQLAMDIGWGYYPRDPVAQRIHHVLAARFLRPESRISGIEHLAGASAEPIVICANHLSYADANVIEVLLQQSGAAQMTDRLTAIAGPKVFSDRQRRFSSLCFGTIKVPQSSDVSSEDAVLSTREVARAARQSIDAALKRLAAGDVLLLFPEGTRSRTADMRTFLPGAARYFEMPGTWIVPLGIVGSEMLFPIGSAQLQPAVVTAAIGAPLRADTILAAAAGDRQRAMDAIGRAIASLLPDNYRGVYGHGHGIHGVHGV
ncbi:MAG: lysophospholipid acyltransferase family protein [Vicinamibacterales bacterium]